MKTLTGPRVGGHRGGGASLLDTLPGGGPRLPSSGARVSPSRAVAVVAIARAGGVADESQGVFLSVSSNAVLECFAHFARSA